MFCDTSNLPRGRDRVRRAAAKPAAYSAHRAQLTFRAEGQPFLKVLPAVCKTVSNIPVSMVALIGRQARTMSRHCLVAEAFRHVPGPQPVAVAAHFMTTGPGDGPGKRMPRVNKQRYPSA
jgi:hypothetical protein